MVSSEILTLRLLISVSSRPNSGLPKRRVVRSKSSAVALILAFEHGARDFRLQAQRGQHGMVEIIKVIQQGWLPSLLPRLLI